MLLEAMVLIFCLVGRVLRGTRIGVKKKMIWSVVSRYLKEASVWLGVGRAQRMGMLSLKPGFPHVIKGVGGIVLVVIDGTGTIDGDNKKSVDWERIDIEHVNGGANLGGIGREKIDWTEEIDKKFIAVLETQAKLENMVHSKIDALFVAREEVNDTFGVAWDKDANVIRASPDYMPLTKAYIYQGESAWDALDVIFGKQREHQALVNKEVIEISSDDDDDPTNGHNGLRIIVENDEDEVNSPPQKIPVIELDPPHVQIQPGDDGSTNMLPESYFVEPKRVSLFKGSSTSMLVRPSCCTEGGKRG
ncbi:hypothetical protein BUALT_Bualt11G0007100 [Buddleja alternifolia]|uniref:Uncharacterized protein n=1 Tax=Buddleja alternifolia TaxID=168488 RepID=A0AAV6X019_9LAMI|nr:hypothetical protein BUALT_Bualt11G0007100 [Buddleja alternifolia]